MKMKLNFIFAALFTGIWRGIRQGVEQDSCPPEADVIQIEMGACKMWER